MFGGGLELETKKIIALDVGYSPNVARSVTTHIENKPGFNNAMAALAFDSNSLALAAMYEFKARGFEDFSNKDLVAALTAIGGAWSRWNIAPVDPLQTNNATNRLRTVILQQIENQTVMPDGTVLYSATPTPSSPDDPYDF